MTSLVAAEQSQKLFDEVGMGDSQRTRSTQKVRTFDCCVVMIGVQN